MIGKYRRRFLDERFKDLDITHAEAPYLMRISCAEQIKMNDLISELPFHKSHTTRAITKLVDDGLITKEINPDDKRAYVLSVTEKGKATGQKIKQIFRDWDNLIDQSITDEEKEVMQKVTMKIYHFLRDYYHEEDTINETHV